MPKSLEFSGRSDLMIVDDLFELCEPRHHEQGLISLKRHRDRAHPGMTDYLVGLIEDLVEFLFTHDFGVSEMLRRIFRMPYLAEQFIRYYTLSAKLIDGYQ